MSISTTNPTAYSVMKPQDIPTITRNNLRSMVSEIAPGMGNESTDNLRSITSYEIARHDNKSGAFVPMVVDKQKTYLFKTKHGNPEVIPIGYQDYKDGYAYYRAITTYLFDNGVDIDDLYGDCLTASVAVTRASDWLKATTKAVRTGYAAYYQIDYLLD